MADTAASSGLGALLSPAQSAANGLAKTSVANSNTDLSDGNISTFSAILAEQGEPVGDLESTQSVVEVSEVFSADNNSVNIDTPLAEALGGGELLPISGNVLPVIATTITLTDQPPVTDSVDPLAVDALIPEQSFLIDPALLKQFTDSLQSSAESLSSDQGEDSAESDLASLLSVDSSSELPVAPVVMPSVMDNQSTDPIATSIKQSSSATSLDLISFLQNKAQVAESAKSAKDASLNTALDLDSNLSFKDGLFSNIAKTDFVFNLKDNFNNTLAKTIELGSVINSNSSNTLDINVLPSWRQQGVDSYSAVQPGSTTLSVSVPVAKPGWGEAVLDKVMWMSSQKMDSADIALDPADLGPMHVRISTHHDQTTVVFTSQHAQVREALDQASGQLRQSLENQGLGQVNVDVSGQNAGQQLASQAQSDGSGNRSADAEVNPDDQLTGVDRPAAVMTSINKLGLVDTFV